MREWPSLIGQKYGMLTVIGQAPSTIKGKRRWLMTAVLADQVVSVRKTIPKEIYANGRWYQSTAR